MSTLHGNRATMQDISGNPTFDSHGCSVDPEHASVELQMMFRAQEDHV